MVVHDPRLPLVVHRALRGQDRGTADDAGHLIARPAWRWFVQQGRVLPLGAAMLPPPPVVALLRLPLLADTAPPPPLLLLLLLLLLLQEGL